MESVDGKARTHIKTPSCGGEEVPFHIFELFFSRTDMRGRIKSGNSVFQRVSQYSWQEMIDRPHNIVRHPDMPRAVFQILWDRVRAGVPVGAYVKNVAKNGRHYWVYAVVTPLEDGFMSVRLKPTSALLQTVAEVYAQVLEHERRTDCRPQESAAVLEDHLRCLGYHDYATFQAKTLYRENNERNRALSRLSTPTIRSFAGLVDAADRLRDAAGKTFATRGAFQYAPLNLRIQAAGLGEKGRTIGVISDNYAELAKTVVNDLDVVVSAADQVAAALSNGLFLALISALQEELYSCFNSEISSAGKYSKDIERLMCQATKYRRESRSSLHEIGMIIQNFFATTDEMRRFASALAAVRVMGTMESAGSGSEALDNLVSDLALFQRTLSEGLETIRRINSGISADYKILITETLRETVRVET